jgi:rRNA processing protein Gar1
MLGAVSKAVAVAGDGVVDMLTVVFDLRPNVFALRTIVLDKSSELVGYVDRVVGHIGRSSALNH